MTRAATKCKAGRWEPSRRGPSGKFLEASLLRNGPCALEGTQFERPYRLPRATPCLLSVRRLSSGSPAPFTSSAPRSFSAANRCCGAGLCPAARAGRSSGRAPGRESLLTSSRISRTAWQDPAPRQERLARRASDRPLAERENSPRPLPGIRGPTERGWEDALSKAHPHWPRPSA